VGWHWCWHIVFYARLWVTTLKTELKGYSACMDASIISQKKSSSFLFAPQSCSGLHQLALAHKRQGSELKEGSRHEARLCNLKTDRGHKQCNASTNIPHLFLSHLCQLSHAPRQNKDLLSPQVAPCEL